ncbi:hypothetical protein VTL71DRAFT_1321 [Oculimacula yallundae]|uniref:BTB domain-containing protein n=1 Tax=Oculimacula yallundae TaxID=86028 RepID=A0ABR4CB56_9HELO
MQRQSLQKSLIVKLKLPSGYTFDDTSNLLVSLSATQTAAVEVAEANMAGSSVAQAATKRRFKIPSMHEPQTMVKVVVTCRLPRINQAYFIHKSFISHYSPVFQSVFDDSLDDTHTIALSALDARVFPNLVHWLYYQTVQAQDGTELCLQELGSLRQLSSKFKMLELENMVINSFHKKMAKDDWSEEDYSKLVLFMKDSTSRPWATGRKMVVENLLITKDRNRLDRVYLMTAGGEIIRDVAKALKDSQLGGPAFAPRLASYYHVSSSKTEN